MRIMIDTNVLISAALFRNSKLAQSVIEVSEKHTVILCSQIIDELHEVFNRKFTDKLIALEIFLTELSYEMVYTPVYYEDIPQLMLAPLICNLLHINKSDKMLKTDLLGLTFC